MPESAFQTERKICAIWRGTPASCPQQSKETIFHSLPGERFFLLAKFSFLVRSQSTTICLSCVQESGFLSFDGHQWVREKKKGLRHEWPEEKARKEMDGRTRKARGNRLFFSPSLPEIVATSFTTLVYVLCFL